MSEPADPLIERRTFLGTAGLGAMAALGVMSEAGTAEPGQRGAGEDANVALVTGFCAAWATRDLAKILPFLAEDSVYRMSETTPPVTGHAGVRERLGSWLETSQQIDFRILE